METINAEISMLLNQLKKANTCNTTYLKIMEARKISDITSQLSITDLIPLQNASYIASKEEEDSHFIYDINEALNNVRPVKQARAFFI